MDAAFIDFINSEFRDFRGRWVRDDLLQPGWLERFQARWGLEVTSPPDEATLSALVGLRSLLGHIVQVLANGQLSGIDLTALNAVLLKTASNRQLVQDDRGYRLEMVPLKKDWDWVQAEIAASFAELLATHDPQRLKVCQNANCRGIFYDESKSRTKRYCTVDKCANLMKVRRFRARHKDVG
jgi:predicted RNA-binding Zn ribbon-like protein